MPRKNYEPDPILAAKRQNIAARRVGVGAACTCGETKPFALVTGSNPVICEECQRRTEGRSTFDDHHVAGEANDPLTVPVPANDHRAVLNVKQYDWPQRTLENRDGSPLLAAAAFIRGFCDTVILFIERLLSRIPKLLETVDSFLTQTLGPRYWTNTNFANFIQRNA